MAEQNKPAPKPPVEPPVETAITFTKMRNISGQVLQLASGALEPGKSTAYDAAEFSTLHLFLEGIE